MMVCSTVGAVGALQLSRAELQQQQQAAAALAICIQHHLAAEDIVRLWCSSRVLQHQCSSLLGSAVLVRSVKATAAAAAEASRPWQPAAATTAKERNSVAALQWLLHQPGITAVTLNQCGQQLLVVHCVPLAAAKALVAAGLRMQITGQQLVQAAYSCVEGLEVWVAAFDSAGVPQQEWAADLPLGMQHVCCFRKVPQQVCVPCVHQHSQGAVQSRVHKQYKCYAVQCLQFQVGIIDAV
jgi:hypothetical protein